MCGFGSGSVFGIRIQFRIRIHYTGATYVVDDDVLLCDLHPNLLGHGLLAEDNTVQQVQALILYNKIAEDCSTRIMKEIYITYLLRAGASSCLPAVQVPEVAFTVYCICYSGASCWLRYPGTCCSSANCFLPVVQVPADAYCLPLVQVPGIAYLLFLIQVPAVAYLLFLI